MSTRPRVRAPELRGRAWLNTDGDVSLRDLRGRFVLLDFWTFCCVNCLHVIDELRPLEERFADELVVVGVHSPKFVHEADPRGARAGGRALLRAPRRPRRPRAGHLAGLHGAGLADAGARRPGGLRRRAVRRRGPRARDRRPARRAGRGAPGQGHPAAGRLAVRRAAGGADRPALPGQGGAAAGRRRAGRGRRARRGRRAGARRARSCAASGASASRTACACCRPTSPPRWGTTSWSPTPSTTSCGGSPSRPARCACSPATAHQWMQGDGIGRLSSPWDVAWWRDRVWVAMAGIHQLWTFDPRTGTVEVAAGTTNEGLLDGPAADAWFAQTSGLAPDGDRLWIADSETSSAALARAGRRRAAVVGPHRRRHRPLRLRLPRRRRPTRRCSSTRSA